MIGVRHTLLMAIAMLCGPACWAQIQASSAAPPPPPGADAAALHKQNQDAVKVAPDLYMITGAGGNVSVRVTSAGIILVDTKNPGGDFYPKLLEAIRTVSDKPVKVVIITHHHGDHSGNGGQFVAAGAEVIGHAHMAARLASPGPDGKPPLPPPNSTYPGTSRRVRLGSSVVEVYHFADGHTDNDSVVYFPDLKTVATGDLFVSVTPMVDYRGGGTLLGTQAAITALLKLDFTTVIPGHGLTPVPRAAIERYKADLDSLVARAEAAIRQGATKDDFLQKVKSDDLGWNLATPQWSGPQASSSIYDELSAAMR